MTTKKRPSSTKSSREREEEVVLGRVNGIFGIRGEVRLFLYNPGSDLLADAQLVTLLLPDGSRRSVRLTIRPGAGKRILGRLEGVDTPEAAQALVGADILFQKDALPDLEEDTFYHHQLLGLPVRTASGVALGVLREIVASGDVDIWVVRDRLGDETYIPAFEDEIVEVRLGVEIVVSDGGGEE